MSLFTNIWKGSVWRGGVGSGGVWQSLLPPTNVTATVSGSTIVITIGTAASSVDGYHYYQSIDDGEWTKLNATATTDLTYTLTPTDPGEYNFRVTSVRGDKESSPSNETTTTESMMTQVYTDTITGLRISAVDGTAFVDEASDITGYADGNHLLEVQDSLGNVLSGVLKAQGSGETLGSPLVVNGDFSTDTTGWIAGSGANLSVVSGELNVTNSAGDSFSVASQEIAVTQNALYSFSRKNISTTGSMGSRLDKTITSFDPISSTQTGVGTHSCYITSPVSTAYVQLYCTGDGATAIFDDATLKQVTAPSTSGCTLVDEINGIDQNLFTVPAGFIYNEASYLIRVKKILPTA